MLLDENSRNIDLFDIEEQAKSFKAELDALTSSRMVAVVGAYGAGKSTYLNILKANIDESKERWLDFDAWKYPDKKDIWEGFVLDICEQVDPTEVDDLSDKIKGVPTKKDNLLKTLLESINLLLTANGIPLAGQAMSKLGLLRRSSPANRVNDFQNILKKQIESVPQDTVYIVAEDVDRSGSYGTIFLEAVRAFLDSIDLSKKVVFLVPVGTNTYREKFREYEKFIDVFSFYELKPENFSNFLKNVVREDVLVDTETGALTYLFAEIVKSDYGTLRTIKLAMRNANVTYQTHIDQGYEPNYCIEIGVQLMKFVFTRETEPNDVPVFSAITKKEWRPSHPAEMRYFDALLKNLTPFMGQEDNVQRFKVVSTDDYLRTVRNLGIKTHLPVVEHVNQNRVGERVQINVFIPDYYINN